MRNKTLVDVRRFHDGAPSSEVFFLSLNNLFIVIRLYVNKLTKLNKNVKMLENLTFLLFLHFCEFLSLAFRVFFEGHVGSSRAVYVM